MERHYKREKIGLSTIESAIQHLCQQLHNDPQLRSEALKVGVDLEAFDADKECPFEVRPTEEGVDVVEIFLVAVTARIAGEYIVRGLDKLWDDVFWPILEQKFGDKLQPDDNNDREV